LAVWRGISVPGYQVEVVVAFYSERGAVTAGEVPMLLTTVVAAIDEELIA
jgi:hypothetical protein